LSRQDASDLDWLGAEALPSGLADFHGSRRMDAAAMRQRQEIPAQLRFPAALLAAGRKWMRRTTRTGS
jgi:hypothetical protein